MAKKRPSLLNAFNTAVPKRVEPPRTQAPEPQRSAQPRFEARPDQTLPVRASSPVPMAPRKALHQERMAPRPSLNRGRLLLLAIAGAVVVLVVMLVLKFTGKSGDAGDSVAHAGASTVTTPNSAPSATPPAQTPASGFDPNAGQTDDDKAFKDARNKFTIRLVQYDNTAANTKLARETYKFLRNEKIPAVQPILSGDGRYIFLCAGAFPKRDDLTVMCDYLKRLRGVDRKSTPFDTAYIDNIDRLISR